MLKLLTVDQEHHLNQFRGTEVAYREQNALDIISQFFINTGKIDSCGNYNAAHILLKAHQRLSSELKEKVKHNKLRFLTDINLDNIVYCKEIMKFALEVRHLPGVKANISVTNTEYFSLVTSNEAKLQSPNNSHVIYSNVKEIVEQQ